MTATEVRQPEVPNEPEHVSGGAKAQAPRRGRAYATRAREAGVYGWEVLRALWTQRKTKAERMAPDPRRSSIWSQAPASITDLLAYTRSGAWAPGDRNRALEGLGKAYGYAVAVPVSAGLYGCAWVLQRPVRLLAVAVFVTLLVISL